MAIRFFPSTASLMKTFVDSTNASEAHTLQMLSRIIMSSLILKPVEYSQSHFIEETIGGQLLMIIEASPDFTA